MKIIRKRRGFTTNSSSAADWVEPIVPIVVNSNGVTTAAMTNQATTNHVSSVPTQNQIMKNNVGSIAGVLCAVVGVFAFERLIRAILKRKRGNS